MSSVGEEVRLWCFPEPMLLAHFSSESLRRKVERNQRAGWVSYQRREVDDALLPFSEDIFGDLCSLSYLFVSLPTCLRYVAREIAILLMQGVLGPNFCFISFFF